MNGSEQRQHKTVTDALATRLDDVDTVVAALDQRVSDAAQAALASIGQERTHRLRLAEEQRGYVDRNDRELRRSIEVLQVRTVVLTQSTFWQRVRWLLFGSPGSSVAPEN